MCGSAAFLFSDYDHLSRDEQANLLPLEALSPSSRDTSPSMSRTAVRVSASTVAPSTGAHGATRPNYQGKIPQIVMAPAPAQSVARVSSTKRAPRATPARPSDTSEQSSRCTSSDTCTSSDYSYVKLAAKPPSRSKSAKAMAHHPTPGPSKHASVSSMSYPDDSDRYYDTVKKKSKPKRKNDKKKPHDKSPKKVKSILKQQAHASHTPQSQPKANNSADKKASETSKRPAPSQAQLNQSKTDTADKKTSETSKKLTPSQTQLSHSKTDTATKKSSENAQKLTPSQAQQSHSKTDRADKKTSETSKRPSPASHKKTSKSKRAPDNKGKEFFIYVYMYNHVICTP